MLILMRLLSVSSPSLGPPVCFYPSHSTKTTFDFGLASRKHHQDELGSVIVGKNRDHIALRSRFCELSNQ